MLGTLIAYMDHYLGFTQSKMACAQLFFSYCEPVIALTSSTPAKCSVR